MDKRTLYCRLSDPEMEAPFVHVHSDIQNKTLFLYNTLLGLFEVPRESIVADPAEFLVRARSDDPEKYRTFWVEKNKGNLGIICTYFARAISSRREARAEKRRNRTEREGKRGERETLSATG